MKTYFQDIHYNRTTPNPLLKGVLSLGEFFYKNIIVFKNFLYEKEVLKEKSVEASVTCVGNLTTGGVGKTPIVISLANSSNEPCAIISRGYGAKLSNKKPVVIKDFEGLKFSNGLLCGDEPYQTAKKTLNKVVVIICSDRVKAAEFAIKNYGIKKIFLDDGFSNRKLKKDKTILVVDSKMRFGNAHLLPYGPLREPVEEIKRADEIIVVNKGDKDFSIEDFKKYNLPIKVCSMKPNRIYNAITKAEIKSSIASSGDLRTGWLSSTYSDLKVNGSIETNGGLTDEESKTNDGYVGKDLKVNESIETNTAIELSYPAAVAFCAIGQPDQFFQFAREFYDLKETIAYPDHHKYTKKDIEKLIKIASKTRVFITTQKDETKLLDLIKDIKGYSFNVLELKTVID